MNRIAIARGAYLAPYCDYLEETGAPIYHHLVSANLPSTFARDDYVAVMPGLRFLAEAARSEGIADFGFQAARRMDSCVLGAMVSGALDGRLSLYDCLEKYSRLVTWECTGFQVSLTWHGTDLRVNSSLIGGLVLPHAEYLQWLQNMVAICIVRQYTDSNWHPATFAFQSHCTPTKEARDFFPSIRFRSGEKASWIDIPEHVLQHRRRVPAHTGQSKGDHIPETSFEPDFLETLMFLLRPYFNDGYPKAEVISKVMGISVRTLQRRLEEGGTNYSELVQQTRHRIARELLANRALSITEIALTVGYSDHSHFTRAFRRLAGISPWAFRQKTAAAATMQ